MKGRTILDAAESTRMIHVGEPGSPLANTPLPPVQRASTVLLSDSGCFGGKPPAGPTYGRGGLTTQARLRMMLADLEHAEDVQLHQSGLAAVTATIQALTSAGDEILLVDSVYNPTRRFIEGTMRRFGVTARYFPPTAGANEIAAMIGSRTRLIVLESPGSLTLDMQDVGAIAAAARARGVRTMIDNTYAAGVFFKPLDHGVDVSVQSLTKYVCGHSDVFMGMAASRGETSAILARASMEAGCAVSPDDAYLAVRGLKTLHARLGLHGEAALTVARWLASRPEVSDVLCPALPGAPGHELWSRDFTGTCGLVSMVLNATVQTAGAMLDRLSLFGLGYSWGGFESLAILCDGQLAARSHPTGLTGPLIRLHVGLENVDDLIADLDTSFGVVRAESRTDVEKEKIAAG